jgi:hypothetical protein
VAQRPDPVKITDLAVFSRNHPKYLREAAGKSPDERVTFRSNVRWVSAADALKRFGPRRIYFAEIDGGGQVGYEADLVQVQVDPSRANPTTRILLTHVLNSTKGEDLWDDSVQTLYVIANCRRVKTAFPQTKLRKAKDGTPLDVNYIRSYALVREIPDAAV